MSTEIEPQEKQTALAKVNAAVTGIQKIAVGITILRDRYADVVFDVTDPKKFAEAKEARAEIRAPRFEVERVRLDAKRDLLAVGKGLDKLAAKITEDILAIEEPIDAQIKAREKEIADEKERKIREEEARVTGIQKRIDEIRSLALNAATSPSITVGQILAQAEGNPIDPDVFQEFTERAIEARATSIEALEKLLEQCKAHEAEQDRLKAAQAELAKQQAEQAERDRIAREEQARLDAAAQAERDAEAARVKEANRIEAQKLADERAENERIARERQAELDRQEAEATAKRDAAAKALAAERAKFEADQEAARVAALPKPEPVSAKVRTVTRPTAEQIVTVVANHWSVSTAMAEKWLRNIKWEQAAA